MLHVPGVVQLWLAMLTLLYIDFLDCTGTMFSMANYLGNFIPGERVVHFNASDLQYRLCD